MGSSCLSRMPSDDPSPKPEGETFSDTHPNRTLMTLPQRTQGRLWTSNRNYNKGKWKSRSFSRKKHKLNMRSRPKMPGLSVPANGEQKQTGLWNVETASSRCCKDIIRYTNAPKAYFHGVNILAQPLLKLYVHRRSIASTFPHPRPVHKAKKETRTF